MPRSPSAPPGIAFSTRQLSDQRQLHEIRSRPRSRDRQHSAFMAASVQDLMTADKRLSWCASKLKDLSGAGRTTMWPPFRIARTARASDASIKPAPRLAGGHVPQHKAQHGSRRRTGPWGGLDRSCRGKSSTLGNST
jgi:hypothetical protein